MIPIETAKSVYLLVTLDGPWHRFTTASCNRIYRSGIERLPANCNDAYYSGVSQWMPINILWLHSEQKPTLFFIIVRWQVARSIILS